MDSMLASAGQRVGPVRNACPLCPRSGAASPCLPLCRLLWSRPPRGFVSRVLVCQTLVRCHLVRCGLGKARPCLPWIRPWRFLSRCGLVLVCRDLGRHVTTMALSAKGKGLLWPWLLRALSATAVVASSAVTFLGLVCCGLIFMASSSAKDPPLPQLPHSCL